MKLICLISSLVVVIFVFTACSSQISDDDKKMLQRIETANYLGQKYLEANYNSYSYNDQYLLFIYPGEELACPIETPCNVTYRLLDAYFDVVLLEQVADVSQMPDQVKDAHAVLSALAKQWESEKIYNTIKSDGTVWLLTLIVFLALWKRMRRWLK